jgi:asparagine synthase (glutamine-hydrolysing)
MCGIAGSIHIQGNADRSSLEEASKQMIHRGPDDEGFFFEGPAGLVHRRLSIIDIDGGRQPMFNEDESLVLVFNGEIYNFLDLRAELESKGHIFSTSSDTEVILHGFEEWGTDCVERFNGMFAIALYNRKDESLFLSRDRCGEKPIYYCHTGKTFSFASELEPLLTIIGHTPSPDPEAIYLYLRFGYIPAPHSFLKGIKKLQAGCSIMFKNGALTKYLYYKPCILNGLNRRSEKELCDELDTTLNKAVKDMLVSDVPLGAFLSGGLDSSLIVAMMANAGKTPRTFSISFDDVSFDESRYARYVSEYIGTHHTHYNVAFDDFDSCLAIMDGFDEPFADSSGIPTYYLARETRKKVKVALSGDGGDELFGGYRRYFSQGLAERYLLLPKALRRGLAIKFLSFFSDGDRYYADSIIKSARIFVDRAEASHGTSGLMLNTIFTHNEVTALFPDLLDGRGMVEELVGEISAGRTGELMHADRCLYLPDDILVKVDRMSMRNSLEMRAPYLYPEILKLSENIPVSMKIKGINLKYLLKKVALRYLPNKIVYRKKHGFMVPMSRWIKKAGEKDIRSRMPSWANAKAVDQALKLHFNGGIDNSHKIFTLIMLGRYRNGQGL